MRILPIAAALLAIQAGAVQAETRVVEATQAAGSSFLELQQFDPSLGQLTQVALTLTGTVSGTVGAEVTSRKPGPFVFTFNLKSSIALGLPGEAAAAALTVTPTWVGNATRSSFDGTLDFSGSSGIFLGELRASATAQQHYTDALILDLFTGAGTLSLPVFTQDLSSIGGVTSYRGGFDATSLASASVTYTYDLHGPLLPPTIEPALPPVPEPTTWALMAAGLAVVGWLAKRRAA